jgi:hypothetical protein
LILQAAGQGARCGVDDFSITSRKIVLKEDLDPMRSQPSKSPTVTYDNEGKPQGLNFHDFQDFSAWAAV